MKQQPTARPQLAFDFAPEVQVTLTELKMIFYHFKQGGAPLIAAYCTKPEEARATLEEALRKDLNAMRQDNMLLHHSVEDVFIRLNTLRDGAQADATLASYLRGSFIEGSAAQSAIRDQFSKAL